MSLARYRTECQALIEELRQSLTEQDAEDLRRDLAATTQAGWTDWRSTNIPAVSQYAAATVGQRAKRKQWSEPTLRRRLTLAAIQHLQLGALLLSEIVDGGLAPGLGYRQMAGAASDAAWRLLHHDPSPWPLRGPSPFSE